MFCLIKGSLKNTYLILPNSLWNLFHLDGDCLNINPIHLLSNFIAMNRKRIILVCLVLLLVMRLFGQTVSFTYDENGNRVSRTITVQRLNSNETKSLLTDPKQLGTQNSRAKSLEVGGSSKTADAKGQDEIIRERIKTEEGEIGFNVYPNPNKGLVKIDISNMPLNSDSEMKLYDLNGNELKVLRNFDNHSEIDISQYRDGIYILRIKINEKRVDWKIIKGQTSGN